MSAVSSAARSKAMQPYGATSARVERKFAPWEERQERVRRLLRTHLAHGLKTVLGATTNLKDYQISRQLSGEDRLTLGVVDVGVALLEENGREDIAQEIRALVAPGSGVIRLDPVTIIYDPRKGNVEVVR